jgi:hypothetical protein
MKVLSTKKAVCIAPIAVIQNVDDPLYQSIKKAMDAPSLFLLIQ